MEKSLQRLEKDLEEARREKDKARQELKRLKQHLLEKVIYPKAMVIIYITCKYFAIILQSSPIFPVIVALKMCNELYFLQCFRVPVDKTL